MAIMSNMVGRSNNSSPLPPGWGRVQPAEYCPGDTLTASYDFLGSDTCATTTDCTPYLPTVTLNTASGAFPSPTSLPPGYTGTLSFLDGAISYADLQQRFAAADAAG